MTSQRYDARHPQTVDKISSLRYLKCNAMFEKRGQRKDGRLVVSLQGRERKDIHRDDSITLSKSSVDEALMTPREDIWHCYNITRACVIQLDMETLSIMTLKYLRGLSNSMHWFMISTGVLRHPFDFDFLKRYSGRHHAVDGQSGTWSLSNHFGSS
nr:hypothetical protein CFP56_37306 [Quercus suber]